MISFSVKERESVASLSRVSEFVFGKDNALDSLIFGGGVGYYDNSCITMFDKYA